MESYLPLEDQKLTHKKQKFLQQQLNERQRKEIEQLQNRIRYIERSTMKSQTQIDTEEKQQQKKVECRKYNEESHCLVVKAREIEEKERLLLQQRANELRQVLEENKDKKLVQIQTQKKDIVSQAKQEKEEISKKIREDHEKELQCKREKVGQMKKRFERRFTGIPDFKETLREDMPVSKSDKVLLDYEREEFSRLKQQMNDLMREEAKKLQALSEAVLRKRQK